jgi:type VI secretion system protein ImpM
MNARGPVGFFGKVPAQGDFVRANVSDPAALQLVHWLEDGNELLHRCGAKLEGEPLAFLFRPLEADRALVGALGPGRDAVGREFPAAVFVPMPALDLVDSFPLVPAAFSAFLRQAHELLADLDKLMSTQITDRLARLQLPGAAELAAAQALACDAAGEPGRDLQERIFGRAPGGQQYYAFRTFQVACRRARETGTARANIAIDCPCARESDVWAWLELARGLLRERTLPSFVWRHGGAAAALVLSPAAPTPAVFPFFASPPHGSQSIWPLRTPQVSAMAAASRALSPSQLAVIDRPDATVGELVASLSESHEGSGAHRI